MGKLTKTKKAILMLGAMLIVQMLFLLITQRDVKGYDEDFAGVLRYNLNNPRRV